MKTSLLLRSRSVPIHFSIPSPKGIRRSGTFTFSPRSASPGEPKANNIQINSERLRRARSDTDLPRSAPIVKALASFPGTVVDEDEEERLEMETGGGFGSGKQTRTHGRGGGGGGGDQSNREIISEYYKTMLSSDPNNTLLLRNYGQFLHEVIGDFREAEKYYSRAILLSPRDGDLLSLYAKLLWDLGENAKAGHYYDLAAKAAPDDRFVLGAQAYFLWSLDEDEDGVENFEEDGVSKGLESLRS
ncbi:putative tetratricopeptide-like helical domain superfamily [Dioscorea sansibarensis]